MSEHNKTDYAILGLLHHEPLSGYDLRKRVKASIGLFWDAGFGQIYPGLGKLEQLGLVTGKTEKGDGRPDKKVYTITASGRKVLQEWLAQPATKEYVRYEILLKLFFGNLVDAERNIATVEEFQRRYRGLLSVLEGYQEDLKAALPSSPDHLYYLLTVQFGLRVYRAYLDWADEALELLQAGIADGPRPRPADKEVS